MHFSHHRRDRQRRACHAARKAGCARREAARRVDGKGKARAMRARAEATFRKAMAA